RAAEAGKPARRLAAIRARRAELPVRTLRATASTVRIVRGQIHAERSAVAVGTARPTGLAIRGALSAGAFLSVAARVGAHAAIVVVRLEIDARAGAVGETGRTRRRALAEGAHLARRTFLSAHPAVFRIALRAHAEVSAFGRAAGALKRAAALHADFASLARFAARTAVGRIALERETIRSALRVAARAAHRRCRLRRRHRVVGSDRRARTARREKDHHERHDRETKG